MKQLRRTLATLLVSVMLLGLVPGYALDSEPADADLPGETVEVAADPVLPEESSEEEPAAGEQEIELMAGGHGILYGKTVTCSSAEGERVQGGETIGPAEFAVDENDSTRWAATGTGEEWIAVDLGEPTPIGAISIAWEAAYPQSFKVQVSADGTTFEDAYDSGALSAKPDSTPIMVNQTIRSLKVACSGAAIGYAASIYEITAIDTADYITGLDAAEAETTVGAAPELPKKVTARFGDEHTELLSVEWDSVPSDSYAVTGSFDVHGTVEGAFERAVCHVTVNAASDAQALAMARRQVGGRVLVPAGDYSDESAIARAATLAAQAKITNDVEVAVVFAADRYVLTLTKGDETYTLDPFTVTLPTQPDDTARYDTVEERIELARRIGAEGVILLKNENETLPLREEDKVAVFGRMQLDTIRGGLGAAYMNPAYEINVTEGLRAAGVNLDEDLAKVYYDWCNEPANKKEEVIYTSDRYFEEMPLTADMVKASKDGGAGKAVVVIGRIVGENYDMLNNEGGFLLTKDEEAMLKLVTEQFDQVAVVYNNGVVANMQFVEDYGVESLVFMGYGGQEGGNYVADVLTGKVVPSGKLTETVAKRYEDYPAADTFSRDNTQPYYEDIYTGYRYFEQFDPSYETVQYPFGFGLSYTTFTISGVSARAEGSRIKVTAKVTNTGSDYSGREVVQVYYSAPQLAEDGPKLSKPGKVLAAFAKTGLLSPGESETMELSFPITDMRSYDDMGVTGHRNAWVMEAGDYDIYVGNSVKDAGEHKAYTYEQKGLRVMEEDLTQMDTALPERLKADGTYETLETISTPGLVSIKDSEVNTVEVENYADADRGVKVNAIPGTEDGEYVLIPAGKSVSYNLQILRGGKYELKFRYSNSGEAVKLADVLTIGVDSGALVLDEDLTLESTDGEWVETTAYVAGLPTGDCVFKLTGALETGVQWDSFTLQRLNNADVVFDIKADGISKVEAEDFSDATKQVRYEEFTDDGQGNPGRCLAWMRAGSRVSYKLNVAETGTYVMKIHYASVGKTSLNSTATFIINNITQTFSDDVSFVSTSKEGNTYYNFLDLDPLVVTLPGGPATLTIESKVAAFPNVDYISFEPVDEGAAMALYAETDSVTFQDVLDDPARMDAFVSQLTPAQLAQLATGQGNVAPNTNTGSIGRLDALAIPGVQTADGPTGVRLSGLTSPIAWPATNIMASSWDVDLCAEYGLAFGKDIKAYDVACILGPSINLQRNPLGGRNFEYFAEDPLLTGKLGAAVTRGIQSVGVATAVKHFAVNSSEFNRLSSNSLISARAMREVYLRAFEIVIKEADPWSIMTSYNFVNGTKAAELTPMMDDLARGEWGYDGVFMTDWGNNSDHVKETLASGDVKMPGGNPDALVAAMADGTLSRFVMEKSTKRILSFIMKTNAVAETAPMDHLAVGKSVTATKSESNNPASNAVDGYAGTRWGTGSTREDQTFTIDLGDVQALGFIRINWETSPLAYELQVSVDGEHFEKVADLTADAQALAQEIPLEDVSARYVRMQSKGIRDISSDGSGSYWGCSIYEFEVYGAGYEPPVEQYTAIVRGGSIAGQDRGLFAEGADVTAVANAAPAGQQFSGWTAVGLELTAEQAAMASLTFKMPANTVILTANFTKAEEPEQPDVPSGGASSSNTAKTEKNPDGSTTKTVTDKKTGAVTETTTYPDGTKIVAVTPKDGETSIEVTVPSGKREVTVTIPTASMPAPGQVAVIIKDDGAREIVKTSVATEDGLRVTLAESAELEILDNSKTFADVTNDHWAADAVQFAASRELFNGTGKDLFSPAAGMTRGMLMTVLARLNGQDTTLGDSWYSAGMDWAKEQSISDGTAPEADVTRESLVVMLYRYAGNPEVDGARRDEVIAPYGDAGSVSDWAADAILWAVNSGILKGSNNKLNPAGTATRAEVAAMLERFVALTAQK